jgi:hypothetical protein
MTKSNVLGVEVLPDKIKFVELNSLGELLRVESHPVADLHSPVSVLVDSLKAMYGRVKKAPKMAISIPAKSLVVKHLNIPVDCSDPYVFLDWEINTLLGGDAEVYSRVFSIQTPAGADAFRSAHVVALRKEEFTSFYQELNQNKIKPDIIDSEVVTMVNLIENKIPCYNGALFKLEGQRNFIINIKDGVIERLIPLSAAHENDQDSLDSLKAEILESVKLIQAEDSLLCGALASKYWSEGASTLGLEISVEKLDPILDVPISGKIAIDEENSSSHAAAYGMALRMEEH